MLLKSLKKLSVNKRLYLIAGHGGSDPGAISNGYKEADLTIEFRDLLRKELEKDYIVLIDGNTSLLNQVLTWLKERLTSKCLLIDIHFNAATPAATGTEIIIDDKACDFEKDLSLLLVNKMSSVLKIRNRGVKSELQTPRKTVAILNLTAYNILLEICFISNKFDMEKYQLHKHELAIELAKIIKGSY